MNEKHEVEDIELCGLVSKIRAPIMFDAEMPTLKPLEEETYKFLIERFPEHIIFKTIQAYRVDSEHDLELALQAGYPVKLVRGAYWQKGNDVFYQTKAETDANYDKLARLLVLRSRAPFCIATHNHRSIEEVKSLSHPQDKRLMFAQLLGMADRITSQLRWEGYWVYKYVPYGSPTQMVPYLTRRLLENLPILMHVL